MKQVKNILTKISNVLVIFAFIIALFALPMAFGIKPYIVLSGSMEPAIHVGSLAYVDTHVDTEELKVGDVITYHVGDVTVTHRIAEKTDEGYYTKGDANDNRDGNLIEPESIEGKVRVAVPYAGYVANFFISPKGKVVIIWLIVLIVLSLWL